MTFTGVAGGGGGRGTDAQWEGDVVGNGGGGVGRGGESCVAEIVPDGFFDADEALLEVFA
jgi:hypothetical protein